MLINDSRPSRLTLTVFSTHLPRQPPQQGADLSRDIPMGYPQLVGLKCSRCNKTIDSIAEGRFCSSCCNPIHLTCMPLRGTVWPEGGCTECGSDPQSPLAMEIKAEIQERIGTGPRVICPNCGSTHGFSPFRPDSGPNPFFLLLGAVPYFLMWIIAAGANVGELQCFKCQYAFRPRNRVREIGCIIILVLALAAIVALIAFRS